jgi:hypothetical protein
MHDGTEHEDQATEGERPCEISLSVKMWRGEQKNAYNASKTVD